MHFPVHEFKNGGTSSLNESAHHSLIWLTRTLKRSCDTLKNYQKKLKYPLDLMNTHPKGAGGKRRKYYCNHSSYFPHYIYQLITRIEPGIRTTHIKPNYLIKNNRVTHSNKSKPKQKCRQCAAVIYLLEALGRLIP